MRRARRRLRLCRVSAAVTAGHHGLKGAGGREGTQNSAAHGALRRLAVDSRTSLAKAGAIAEARLGQNYLRHEAGNSFDAARVDAF